MRDARQLVRLDDVNYAQVGSVLVVKTHHFALPPHTKPSALLFTTGTTQERLFGFGKPMPLKVPRNVAPYADIKVSRLNYQGCTSTKLTSTQVALGTHLVYGDFLQNSILATVCAETWPES